MQQTRKRSKSSPLLLSQQLEHDADEQQTSKRTRLHATDHSSNPALHTLEEAIYSLEKRKIQSMREINKQQQIVQEIDEQITNLRAASRCNTQVENFAPQIDALFAVLPDDVALYILEYYDLSYYQPFLFETFKSSLRVSLFFGYFK
jgi:septal ring factor EnvC (AmiA/AmiB activator)